MIRVKELEPESPERTWTVDIKDLKGLAVVAVQDGQRLGEVSDILLSPGDRRVVRLQISSGGLFSGRTTLVEMDAVSSIGPDAVMIPGRDAVRAESEESSRELLSLREFTSLRVVSDQGRLLGTVAGAEVETPSGRLATIEFAPVGLSGLFGRRQSIPIEQVISIGRDVVVVPESAVQAEEPDTAETGGPAGR